MAKDYPLEELSPRAFEQLAVALSMKVLGHGVSSFGSGPDGGREATYHGPVEWSATSGFGDDSWNGYVVVQAKQREHPSDPGNNAAWLRRQIDAEFDEWLADKGRGRFPEYIVFITNVRLSSVSRKGGIDSLEEVIRKRVHDAGSESLSHRGLKGWKIWHRDQLNALLTENASIRNAFPAMLTAGDILTRLGDLSGIINTNELHSVLTEHGYTTLSAERWVNFNEAGGSNRQSVENVVVDIDVNAPGGLATTAIRQVITQGDLVLRRSMTQPGAARHIVLTGQPGNGKSTLSKFLTQVYRSRFMEDETSTSTTKGILDGTRAALDRMAIDAPKNRRWPLRIDLAAVADDLGPSGDKSLLRWLSERVTLRANLEIQPVTLKRWLRHWPSVLILDGLDEVTSPEVRRRVLDEIHTLQEEADRDDADMLLVLTTRPTGYTERVAPEHFTQYDLRSLSAKNAIEYGKLVTSLRLSDDLDLRDRVLARFEKHVGDPNMVRLMKTPLQVLIMTFILERLGNLPADRYQLFWRYYETVYEREAAKNTTLSSLFTDHRSAIMELHERVGLELQIQSETAADARALLPLSTLRAFAEERLRELGYESSPEAARVADKIITAATQRLVLLVADENETVTFEIRSLQELMAARGLSNGQDELVRRRLSLTAASPHWRNSWIFAAGRQFAEGPDHRRDLVCEVVETIDVQPGWPGWLCAIGPELAADLLSEGLGTTTPKWQRRLIDVALRALAGPFPIDVVGLARGLTATVGTRNHLMYIRSALKHAGSGTPQAREVAAILEELGTFDSKIPGVPEPRTKKFSEVDHGSISVRDLVNDSLDQVVAPTNVLKTVGDALDELANLRLDLHPDDCLSPIDPNPAAAWPKTVAALSDDDASEVMALLFGQLDAKDWPAATHLAHAVWPSLARPPVGHLLNKPD